VKPKILLEDLAKAVPISEKVLWDNLHFTQDPMWISMVRSSLRELNEHDGRILVETLTTQGGSNAIKYGLTQADQKKLKAQKHTVKTREKVVAVSVPENETDIGQQPAMSEDAEVRESIRIQAELARIGEQMGMKIWIPRSDRQRVLSYLGRKLPSLVDSLPLNYDSTTLTTIENIDVLWLKGRAIVRAFEVEHKTSIYSGILRMADLMALQPNLDIKAHIVGPEERKEKVFQEIARPVFSLLDGKPLSERCTFISYDSVLELAKEKKLQYMSDMVLEQYQESATDE